MHDGSSDLPARSTRRRLHTCLCLTPVLGALLGAAAVRAQPGHAPGHDAGGRMAAFDSVRELEALGAEIDALVRRVEQEAGGPAGRSAPPQDAPADLGEPSLDDGAIDEELLSVLQADAIPAGFEPELRLYGFMDAGIQRIWGGFFSSGLALSDASNFVIGNINLYFDATPIEQWRALVEVRFTNLPHGAEKTGLATGDFTRQDTTVQDYTSAAGGYFGVRWGSIILERAHIEWSHADEFNLRVGYFLTPYGIWNVEHGSPTRIMVRPPFFISIEQLPERQTGVEAYGVVHAIPWDIGYSAYISNGRTVGNVDFSEDKALGGRLYARSMRPFPMQFGVSFLWTTAQDVTKRPSVDAAGGVILVRDEVVAYREISAGLDVSLDIGSLRIRAEALAAQLVFEDGKRQVFFGAQISDVIHAGGYLLLAYRLPWLGLEPTLIAEFLRYPIAIFGEYIVFPGCGLNVYINPAVTLRLQYTYAKSVTLEDTTRDYSQVYLHVAAARLVIAF